jgi:hypothetical protein
LPNEFILRYCYRVIIFYFMHLSAALYLKILHQLTLFFLLPSLFVKSHYHMLVLVIRRSIILVHRSHKQLQKFMCIITILEHMRSVFTYQKLYRLWRKCIWDRVCVSVLFTIFVWNTFYSNKYLVSYMWGTLEMCAGVRVGLHVKRLLLSSDFSTNCICHSSLIKFPNIFLL